MSETILQQWRRLGVGFNVPPFKGFVDPETLIAESLKEVGDDPRLFYGMTNWIKNNSDLLNLHKLMAVVEVEYSALLGLMFDVALEHGGEKRLEPFMNRCVPESKKAFLFRVSERYTSVSKLVQKNTLSIFRKWGFYCDSLDMNDKAVFTRAYILKNNLNLSIRALFGPGARAEILTNILLEKKTFVNKIVKAVHLSYEPVYKEVNQLLKNHFLVMEKIGNVKLVSLAPGTLKFLKQIPQG